MSSCWRKKRTRAAGSCLSPPRVVPITGIGARAGLCGTSLLGPPRGGGGGGEEDQVDSLLRSSSTPAVAYAGWFGWFFSRFVPCCVYRPEMPRIMAGTHQKDSCLRCTGKLDYLGEDLIMFPYHRNAWTSVLHAMRQRTVLRFSSTPPLSDSHLFDVVQEYRILDLSWRRLPEMFLYSALVGSTVDTSSRQSAALFRISAQCLV